MINPWQRGFIGSYKKRPTATTRQAQRPTRAPAKREAPDTTPGGTESSGFALFAAFLLAAALACFFGLAFFAFLAALGAPFLGLAFLVEESRSGARFAPCSATAAVSVASAATVWLSMLIPILSGGSWSAHHDSSLCRHEKASGKRQIVAELFKTCR